MNQKTYFWSLVDSSLSKQYISAQTSCYGIYRLSYKKREKIFLTVLPLLY